MVYTRAPILAFLFALVCGCGDSGGDRTAPTDAEGQRPALELDFSEAPIELPGIAASFARDVRYGDAERNLFDIYLPDCDDPTPLVIYVHGGGFLQGDKSETHERFTEDIREFLQACVAWATVNYTLLVVPESDADLPLAAQQGGVRTSLNDSARALQFMRYHFESLNLDPDNVAMYGGSAGAGTSLWLGTHDDLADPGNPDPVLRESTRLQAVAALATQATYDILRWDEFLLPITEPFADLLGGTEILQVAQTLGSTRYLLTFLGAESVAELHTAENEAYRADVDMLALMDAADTPFYAQNFDVGFDDLLDTFLHHGLHAIALKERADEVGLHSVVYSDDRFFNLQDPSGEGWVSFILRHID